jgi:hypothetical protein
VPSDGTECRLFARVGPTTPKHFGAKLQTCPHLAVRAPPDGSLSVGAAEVCAAIRRFLIGDSPRETEMVEPTSSPPAGSTSDMVAAPCAHTHIDQRGRPRHDQLGDAPGLLDIEHPNAPAPASGSARAAGLQIYSVEFIFLFITYKRSNGPSRRGSDRGCNPSRFR